MWQWFKCFFGEHDWYWFRGDVRQCKACGLRQHKEVRVNWRDLW